MNINTRDMNFIKFNGEEMQWVKVNGVTVYEAWKRLTAQGSVPLVLMKSNGMDLVDYKIFGNSRPEATRIPQEYQEVEYIQNSGAQYIDAGFIPDNSTGVELVYKALDYTTSQYLVGARVGWSGTIFYGINGSGSRTEWDVRFNSSTTYSSIQRTDHKMKTKVILNNGNGTWDLEDLETGEKFDTTLTGKSVSATTNLMLFAYSPDNIHKKLRIYSCKLYSGEELIKDFVPCYRKSDNVRGMYDLINGVFHEEILNTTTIHCSVGNYTGTELEAVGNYDGDKYVIPVTISNNLFSLAQVEQGSITDASGVLASSDSRVRTSLFALEAGAYNISMNWSLQKCMIKGVHVYNYDDEKWIKYISGGTSNLNISLDERSKIRIVFNKSASAGETVTPEEILNSNVIISPGGVTIEPAEEKVNIYLDKPLFKLGDYADTIDFKQGKVVRRIGKYTYNGSEEWLKNASTVDGYGAFRCEGVFDPLIGASPEASYMTHFIRTTKGATADFVPGEFRFAYVDGAIGNSRVYMAAVQTNVEDFIAWVSENQPTVYYPIEDTPEEINLPAIPTLEKITILHIDTIIQPDHIEVVYMGK